MWPYIVAAAGVVGVAFLVVQRLLALAPRRPEAIVTSAKTVGAKMTATSVISLDSGTFYVDHSQRFAVDLDTASAFQPATVLDLDADAGFTVADIAEALQRFRRTDDVFDDSFLSAVVLLYDDGQSCLLTEKAHDYLQTLGTQRVYFVKRRNAVDRVLSEGPYLATPEGLLPVWKLFPDTCGAFVASTVQDKHHRFTYVNAMAPEAVSNLAIAVPSRLYFPPRPDKPLNGKRVALKDNIDLAGCRTFASCRAYGELYGVAVKSAPAAQALIDLGAIIVGKTGMSQFADAEAPTADFVDFLAPFNPRGDGNRTPGGSSFGSGAAAGAYEWLDFTIGTDTGGSVRQPAAHQAVYGLRPSRGRMSLEGTVMIHRDLDAIGILSKDLSVLRQAAHYYFNASSTLTMNPSSAPAAPTLIYPSHLFPVENEAAQKLFDNVVVAFERQLHVERRVVDFKYEWKRAQSFTKEEFEDYFAPLLYDFVTWGQYHERASFRAEYKKTFEREPHVNGIAQVRWRDGALMTSEYFQDIIARRQQFQDFIESVFSNNSIMITPFLWLEPQSREIYRPCPSERPKKDLAWGLLPEFQSPFAGQPELVFPIGQLPVQSTVSRREERYGVVASIIGSKGMDSTIVDITQQVLRQMNLPERVLTGRFPFSE